jgi:hypothetical protein
MFHGVFSMAYDPSTLAQASFTDIIMFDNGYYNIVNGTTIMAYDFFISNVQLENFSFKNIRSFDIAGHGITQSLCCYGRNSYVENYNYYTGTVTPAGSLSPGEVYQGTTPFNIHWGHLGLNGRGSTLYEIRLSADSILSKLGAAKLVCPFNYDRTLSSTVLDYSRLVNSLTSSTSLLGWHGWRATGSKIHAMYYDFNGSSNYLYHADSADFTFGTGLADVPFSIVALVCPDNVTSRTIMCKWAETVALPQREWRFFFDVNGYPTLQLWDESGDKYIGRQDQTAFPTTADTWRVLVATYSGSATSAGCKIYIDGVQLDDADYENGGYVAMEDTASQFYVGCKLGAAARDEFYDGKMAWVCVTGTELTVDQVWGVTQRIWAEIGM